MKRLAIPAILCLICGSAFSAEPFVGAALGLGASFTDNEVKYGGFLDGKTSSENEVSGKLLASYGLAMGRDWVGTFGVDYTVGKQSYGSTTYVSGGTQTVKGEMKDVWSLSFAPGYRTSANTLLYGKLAYHAGKGVYTDTLPANGTTHHTGFGYGAGFAMTLCPHLEASIEVEHVDYSREAAVQSTGKPTQNALTLGINYRF